jgi:hypothetical protein
MRCPPLCPALHPTPTQPLRHCHLDASLTHTPPAPAGVQPHGLDARLWPGRRCLVLGGSRGRAQPALQAVHGSQAAAEGQAAVLDTGGGAAPRTQADVGGTWHNLRTQTARCSSYPRLCWSNHAWSPIILPHPSHPVPPPLQDFGSRVGVSSDLVEEGAAAGGLWGSSDPLSESPERALDKSFKLQVRRRGGVRGSRGAWHQHKNVRGHV